MRVGTATKSLLWIMFTATCVNALVGSGGQKNTAYYASYYTIQAGAIGLIALAIRYLPRLRSYEQRFQGYWLLRFFLLCCGIGCIAGLFSGIIPRDFVYLGVLPFGGSLLILLARQPSVRQGLVGVLVAQSAIAVVLGVYGVVVAGPFGTEGLSSLAATRDLWYQSPEAASSNFLAVVAFLLPGVGWLPGPASITIMLSYVVFLGVNLRGANRQAVLSYALLVPFLTAVVAMGRISSKMRKRLAWMTLAVLGSVTIAWTWTDASVAVSLFYFRLTSESEWIGFIQTVQALAAQFGQEYQDIRGAEASDFLQAMPWWVYLFGRGFGATWYSKYWGQDWNIVHTGPLYLIFRGGIPLLVAFYSLVLAAIYRSWRCRRLDLIARCSFVFLTVKLIAFFFYGAYTSEYWTFVFWLVVGTGLASSPKSESQAASKEPLAAGGATQ